MTQPRNDRALRRVAAAAFGALLCSAALAQQATVEATVQLEDGSPVAGAQVRVVATSSGKANRQGKTKKNGECKLPFVEFGTYRFNASKDGLLIGHLKVTILLVNHQVDRDWESDIGPLQEVPEFEILPSQTAQLTFTMVPKERFAEGLNIPGNAKATGRFEEANRLSGEGEYAKSTEILEEILDSGEATANVYYILGRNAFALKDSASAEKWFTKTLELNPTQAGAAGQLGTIAYERGDKEAAAKYFAQEVENSPDAVAARVNLGLVQSELGRTDEAIATFEKVIEAAPNDVAAHTELVRLYMETGQTDRATALLEHIESFAKPDPALWFNIGAGFSNADQYEQAAWAYGKAIAIDPTFPDAYRELGYLDVRDGRTADAVTHLEKYLELRPDAADAGDIRAVIEALKKRSAG